MKRVLGSRPRRGAAARLSFGRLRLERQHVRPEPRGHLLRKGVIVLGQQPLVQSLTERTDPTMVERLEDRGIHPLPVVHRHDQTSEPISIIADPIHPNRPQRPGLDGAPNGGDGSESVLEPRMGRPRIARGASPWTRCPHSWSPNGATVLHLAPGFAGERSRRFAAGEGARAHMSAPRGILPELLTRHFLQLADIATSRTNAIMAQFVTNKLATWS